MRSCDNTGNRSCAYMMTVCSYFIALFLSGNIRHNQSWFKKKQHTNTIIGILVKHLDRNITTESLRVTSLAATLGHGRSSRVNLEICWFGRCGFGGDMRHVVSLNSVSEIRQKCSWGGKTGQTKHLSISQAAFYSSQAFRFRSECDENKQTKRQNLVYIKVRLSIIHMHTSCSNLIN